MVPGSTLMYGSSLMLVTRMPRDSRIAAREAAAIPFPREETTPPVTKTYLVMTDLVLEITILPDKRSLARTRCSRFQLAVDVGIDIRGALAGDLLRGERQLRAEHRVR